LLTFYYFRNFSSVGRVIHVTPFHSQVQPARQGNPMTEAEHFLQDARKSFRLAAEAVGLKEIERYSAMGRDYLQLAHNATKLKEAGISPSLG
jgi:hypothetical protein